MTHCHLFKLVDCFYLAGWWSFMVGGGGGSTVAGVGIALADE